MKDWFMQKKLLMSTGIIIISFVFLYFGLMTETVVSNTVIWALGLFAGTDTVEKFAPNK